MTNMFVSLSCLVDEISDGHQLALPADYAGAAMHAVDVLLERPVSGLHLIGIPQMGFQADMLIGAGKVACVESAAVTLGEYGFAPCFTRAVCEGGIEIRDATCPALLTGLQASEKGVPFMPLRGLIGSDVLNMRDDWKVINNPFTDDDPIVVLPAIKPDVLLFHAPRADRHGNVWIGIRRELALAAHAAKRTLVSVEEVCDEDFLSDREQAPGILPSLYVSAIAHAPGGAKPLGLTGCYPPDAAALEDYAKAAATAQGFTAWRNTRRRGTCAA